MSIRLTIWKCCKSLIYPYWFFYLLLLIILLHAFCSSVGFSLCVLLTFRTIMSCWCIDFFIMKWLLLFLVIFWALKSTWTDLTVAPPLPLWIILNIGLSLLLMIKLKPLMCVLLLQSVLSLVLNIPEPLSRMNLCYTEHFHSFWCCF